MKKIYHIEIEEILQNVYEIEAESSQEAMEIAKEKYRNEEYVLQAEDLKETNFTEYAPPTRIKNNKNKFDIER